MSQSENRVNKLIKISCYFCQCTAIYHHRLCCGFFCTYAYIHHTKMDDTLLVFHFTVVITRNALGIWICGCRCRCILESSRSQNSGCTQYQKPQNQRVQKVISQSSAGLCTRCTRVNAFPVCFCPCLGYKNCRRRGGGGSTNGKILSTQLLIAP